MVKSKQIVRTETTMLKTHMVGYLLYKKQYMVAFTESFNDSDVFAIKRSHFTIEVEVKKTKDDLRGELNSIRAIVDKTDEDDLYGGIKIKGTKKFHKHLAYINGKNRFTKMILPNEFCFLVPEELLEQAYAGIQKTPYGLFCYRPYLGEYYERIEQVVQPKKLHDEKYDFSKNVGLLYRASNECQFLREKMYGGWPEDSERVSEVKMMNF